MNNYQSTKVFGMAENAVLILISTVCAYFNLLGIIPLLVLSFCCIGLVGNFLSLMLSNDLAKNNSENLFNGFIANKMKKHH